MRNRTLFRLKNISLYTLRRSMRPHKLMNLLGIIFVAIGNSQAEAIPLTKEQSVLENRIEAVRDKLLKQDKFNIDKTDGEQIAQWYNWNNWPNWPNWGNWPNWRNY